MFTLTLEQRAVVWGGFQAESFVTPSLSLRCGVLSLAFLLIDGETEKSASRDAQQVGGPVPSLRTERVAGSRAHAPPSPRG